jgi:hypothetical protein
MKNNALDKLEAIMASQFDFGIPNPTTNLQTYKKQEEEDSDAVCNENDSNTAVISSLQDGEVKSTEIIYFQEPPRAALQNKHLFKKAKFDFMVRFFASFLNLTIKFKEMISQVK